MRASRRRQDIVGNKTINVIATNINQWQTQVLAYFEGTDVDIVLLCEPRLSINEA